MAPPATQNKTAGAGQRTAAAANGAVPRATQNKAADPGQRTVTAANGAAPRAAQTGTAAAAKGTAPRATQGGVADAASTSGRGDQQAQRAAAQPGGGHRGAAARASQPGGAQAPRHGRGAARTSQPGGAPAPRHSNRHKKRNAGAAAAAAPPPPAETAEAEEAPNDLLGVGLPAWMDTLWAFHVQVVQHHHALCIAAEASPGNLWALAEILGHLALKICTWLATTFTCVCVPLVRHHSLSAVLCPPCALSFSLPFRCCRPQRRFALSAVHSCSMRAVQLPHAIRNF